MITKEKLEGVGFELYSHVYEKRCAKRVFINVEKIKDGWKVELEVDRGSIVIPHIKNMEDISNLYFAITGAHLGK